MLLKYKHIKNSKICYSTFYPLDLKLAYDATSNRVDPLSTISLSMVSIILSVNSGLKTENGKIPEGNNS
jgi:hypothetical protein